MSKLTPGPWEALDDTSDGHWYIVSKSETEYTGSADVCTIYVYSGDEAKCEADARLIAAAPDLYEALNELIASTVSWGPLPGTLVGKCQKALAKAGPA